MSDTPETDALIAYLERTSGCKAEGDDLVVIEFLRKMERERNEMRAELIDWEQRAYGAEDEVKTLRDASASDTPRTDTFSREARKADSFKAHVQALENFARQLERELTVCQESLTALAGEMAQAKLPVIGECEECGHKIVCPLRRF